MNSPVQNINTGIAYRPCELQSNTPCLWVADVQCIRCPIATSLGVVPDDVESYMYAPSPVKLRYELVCHSEHYYRDEVDRHYAQEQNLPNWAECFDGLYRSLDNWLRFDKGVERVRGSYRPALSMILANFLINGHEHQILMPKTKVSCPRRNPAEIGYKVVNDILDFLTDKQLIWRMKGIPQCEMKAGTWYMGSPRLLKGLNEHIVTVRYHEQTIWLDFKMRNTSTKKWEAVKLPDDLHEQAIALHKPAKHFIDLWSRHEAVLDGKSIRPSIWRVFNGSLEKGGRFYGRYLTLSKDERSCILIDGEETVEPDFEALHPNLLYAHIGFQNEGDPYEVDGLERNTVKSVFLPMLNHRYRSSFIWQITKSGKPEIKQEREAYFKLVEYRRMYGHKIPEMHGMLKGFIENIPDNQDGALLLEAIEAAHPQIQDQFFSPDLGLRLQFLDSQIMAAIITELARLDIPILPVHDSVRCKKSDVEVVIDVMQRMYREMTGFECSVDVG